MVDDITLQGFTTYTGKALHKAIYEFEQHNKPGQTKIIVLLTDGECVYSTLCRCTC